MPQKPDKSSKPKLTVEDFAAKYKASNPAYKGYDDATLVNMILRDHPDFASRIQSSQTYSLQNKSTGGVNSYQVVKRGQEGFPSGQTVSSVSEQQRSQTLGELESEHNLMGESPEVYALTEMLPTLGGMAGSLYGGGAARMGGSALLRRMGYSALGGMLGEEGAQGVKRLANTPDKPTDFVGSQIPVLESGLMQGGMEGAGELAGLVPKRIMAGTNAGRPWSEAEMANARMSLGLTPKSLSTNPHLKLAETAVESNPAGNLMARQARENAEKQVQYQLFKASKFDRSPVDWAAFGRRLKNYMPESKQVFQEQVQFLSDQLDRQTEGVTADTTEIKRLARSELRQIQSKQTTGIGPDELMSGGRLRIHDPSAGRRMILEDILKLNDEVPFRVLNNFRSRLMNAGRGAEDSMFASENQSTAKFYTKKVTEALDKAVSFGPETVRLDLEGTAPMNRRLSSAALSNWHHLPEGTVAEMTSRTRPTPEIRTAWNAFRNFTRKGYDSLEHPSVENILKADPEAVADGIGPRDVTGARAMKRAIKTYVMAPAGRGGTAAQQQAALRMWDEMRQAWTQRYLLSGKLEEFPERLAKVTNVPSNKGVLDIFADDAKGRAAKASLVQLAVVIDKMGKLPFPKRGNLLFSYIEHLYTTPIAHVIYNPKSAIFLTRGLAGLAKASDHDFRLVGMSKSPQFQVATGWEKASPKLGQAMVNIFRAYQIAGVANTAFGPQLNQALEEGASPEAKRFADQQQGWSLEDVPEQYRNSQASQPKFGEQLMQSLGLRR